MTSSKMNCACGHEERDIIRLNRHRRQCSSFWQAVYAEMERIAVALYGRVAPISVSEWDANRSDEFPNMKTFRDWGKVWVQIQEGSGHGVSPLGRSAPVAKGAPEKRPTWEKLEVMPDYTGAYNSEYAALPSDGLSVCEETYRRTGRMMLR